MKKFGIKMDGCEEELEASLLQSFREKNPDTPFVVCEIGFADGVTHRALREILEEENDGSREWFSIAVDIKKGYEAALPAISRSFPSFENLRVCEVPEGSNQKVEFTGKDEHDAHLFLKDSSRFVSENFPEDLRVDFAIIDACHCKKHIVSDFEALEPFFTEGSRVVFHDVGDAEQGEDLQHDGHYIETQEALRELNLFEAGENFRGGWTLEKVIDGGRTKGMLEGNSCAIYKKTR
jgi:hypothetical protein